MDILNVKACYNVEFTIDYCSRYPVVMKISVQNGVNEQAKDWYIQPGKPRGSVCAWGRGGGGQSREVWLMVSHSRGLKNLTLSMKVDLVNFEINRVKDTFILRWWNKGIFAKKKNRPLIANAHALWLASDAKVTPLEARTRHESYMHSDGLWFISISRSMKHLSVLLLSPG